jgi:hypothetical protein
MLMEVFFDHLEPFSGHIAVCLVVIFWQEA